MITQTSETVVVQRVDADVACDGLGLPPCKASLGYTIIDGEAPRQCAAQDGWWSDGVIDLCPSCQRQPHRHIYVEPRSGPRWDNGCRLCAYLPDAHGVTS